MTRRHETPLSTNNKVRVFSGQSLHFYERTSREYMALSIGANQESSLVVQARRENTRYYGEQQRYRARFVIDT
jgi:hypothetical protein